MKDSNFLKEMNARHLWHPMADPAEMQAKPPTIVTEAEGVHITDIDGHRVIDAVGGLWNVNLGFSCQPVKDAITAQLDRMPYYNVFRGATNDVAIELSTILTEFFAEEGMARAFYTSGGGDSVETALRLSRQYHKLRGDEGRVKYLSLKKGYHGTHFGCASVNGNAHFRRPYEPLLPGCFHIPAPYPYRNPFNTDDAAEVAQLCLNALEDEIAFQGADTIAAFIMEPILGAGGVIVPHESFMPGVRDICSRHGILLISDEVITGFGRTGDWSGARHWGVQPDMMTTAKAITNGYFPFGAVMLSEQVASAFETGETNAMIGHGYTYSGHPVGAAAAIASIEVMKRMEVHKNAAARGDHLYQGFLKLQEKYSLIGDVRGGHGMMLALECVADRETKVPADKKIVQRIFDTVYEAGVMIRVSGPNIIVSPPLVLSDAEADGVLDVLDTGFAEVS